MKYLVEFIGTFFLVLTIGMTVIGGAGLFAPLAIGSVLMVMIFAGGHISGAHYNPAVTIAVWVRGRCSTGDVPFYILAQILAGILAAFVVMFFFGGETDAAGKAILPSSPEAFGGAKIMKAMLAEFLGAFALCYVVLQTATSKDHDGNSFYGLAIGFTVLAMAYAFGGVSGGAFNPAVAFGISFMKLTAWANIWIYLVGNFAAGALAGIVFKMTNPHDA